MIEELLDMDWNNLTEQDIKRVRSYLLGKHSATKEERLDIGRRAQAWNGILKGFSEIHSDQDIQYDTTVVPMKFAFASMLAANIGTAPPLQKLYFAAELIKLYTNNPLTYEHIGPDPFIFDQVRGAVSMSTPDSLLSIVRLTLDKTKSEERISELETVPPDLVIGLKKVTDDESYALETFALDFIKHYFSDFSSNEERVMLRFQAARTTSYVDTSLDVVKNGQRKLEEAVSLSLLPYKHFVLPHEWNYMDLGPNISALIREHCTKLPLIREYVPFSK